MSAKVFWTIVISGGLGGAWVAQAQVNSPFASKKTRQAWETAPAAPAPVAPTAPSTAPVPLPPPNYAPQTAPQTTFQAPSLQAAPTQSFQLPPQPAAASAYSAPTYSQPSAPQPTVSSPFYQVPQAQARQAQTPSAPSYYQPQSAPPPASRSPFAPKTAPTYQGQTFQDQTYQAPPIYTYEGQAYSGQNYQGQNYQGQAPTTYTYQGQTYQGQFPQYPNYQNQPNQAQTYQGQTYQGQPSQIPAAPTRPKRSWKERLGFGNFAHSLSGFLKVGAAAVRRESDFTGIDEWDDGYVADGQIRGEVSAITQGGLEYGIGGVVRGQYDQFRRGFGGLVGDCPPDVAGCASVDVNGVPTAVRGHTSRFFSSGVTDAREFEFALEGAYGFLRTSYGDITIGRDDGAAYLFSLGAPSLSAVNASNSPVDYTGLDSVKTVNDASGFSEKITYTSPRLLGDRIGVGVQIGASYALNARACGVDFCVRENGADGTGALAPDLDDVIEVGLSLDRTFSNGLNIEATGTYARASEQSSLAAFDNLQSFGAGLEAEWNDFTLGGAWLQSNNGLADGDYTAWDVGLSWKPARWGASIAYGRAVDDNVNLTSDQITLGGVYDINERFSFGTGVQYVDRTITSAVGGALTPQDERGIGVFVEGKFTF